MIKKREIAMCIVLSILTCGIYGIYWICKMTDDVASMNTKEYSTSGGTAFILMLLTCGIYGIYWAYKMGKALDEINESRGRASKDRALVYVLLSCVGLSIVSWILIQSELNELAEDA